MLSIDLSDHVAVVTGSSNGVGRAIVTSLTDAGARVIGVDVEPPGDVRPDVFLPGDVSDDTVAERACTTAFEHGGRVVLVNNAARQVEATLDQTDGDTVRDLFAINAIAPVRWIQIFGRRMTAGCSVVNIASVLGLSGDADLAAYTVTKGAVVNLTRTAAIDLGKRGIRVNAVCPGAIRTPLTTRVWDASGDAAAAEERMSRVYPLGRIGEPGEVGSVVAFLASDLASFISGALLTVDGGLLAANAEYGLTHLAP